MGLLDYAPDFRMLTRNPNDPNYTPPPVVPPTGGGGVISPYVPPLGTTTPPVTAPTGGGGGGGSADPYPGLAALNGLPTFKFGAVPVFAPAPFVAPTAADAMNSPGYQFRLETGEQAVERSAAAKGLLRTGGTFKDIMDYGKNFAQGEYNSDFNNALQGYEANYQGQKDSFAPKLAQWQLQSQAQMQAILAQYQRQWDIYSFTHKGANVFAPVGYPPQIPAPPTPPDVRF